MGVSTGSETVSLIVPALNEQAAVRAVVHDIVAVMTGRLADFEIILIDDGSSDCTGAIMDELAATHPAFRVLHNASNIGLGASYRRGVAAARFDYVMMLCGDGGLPAASLPPILGRIGAADIVVPYMTNLRAIKSPLRYLLSRGYTGLLNLLFGLRLRYYNGLSVHRRDLLQSIDISGSGFAFQGEILVKLIKSGHSYVEVGVQGAVGRERSSALHLRNLASVALTLVRLVWGMRHYLGWQVPAGTSVKAA